MCVCGREEQAMKSRARFEVPPSGSRAPRRHRLADRIFPAFTRTPALLLLLLLYSIILLQTTEYYFVQESGYLHVSNLGCVVLYNAIMMHPHGCVRWVAPLG